jgi:thiol:disulfide interchange protein
MLVAALWWIFKLLPDIAGIFLAVLAFAVVVNPAWIKGFEGDQKRRMRTLAALFLVALGIAAVVSNQVQKSVDSANAKKDQGKVQNSVDDLGKQLQDEKLNHTAEAQYLAAGLTNYHNSRLRFLSLHKLVKRIPASYMNRRS